MLWGVRNQSTAQTNSSRKSDPYSVAFVDSALQFFKRAASEKVASFEVKNFTNLSPSLPGLGDAVSITVLKIFDREELAKPENTNAYLTIVRTAFSDRNQVLEKSDSVPKITLFVLSYLEEKKVREPEIEKRISYLKQCIGGFSCSPQGEYAFFKKP